eukprot:1364371-Pleurochrysis_carterae.AAC.1
MMREARNRVKGEQKGTRKVARARNKADVNLFTALEPPLGSNPIFCMRQAAFEPNELEIVVARTYRSTFMVRFDLGRFRQDVVGRPGLNIHLWVASWPASF